MGTLSILVTPLLRGARGYLDLIVKQQSLLSLKTLSQFAIPKNLL
jgi:hypothetical protein